MRLLALALVATLAVPLDASAKQQGQPRPDRGAVLVAGHVAGVVYPREAPEGVIALDTLLVVDGNVMEQGEQPGALEQRRTWVGGVEVRCSLSTGTCELGEWFLQQVAPESDPGCDTVRTVTLAPGETRSVRVEAALDPGAYRVGGTLLRLPGDRERAGRLDTPPLRVFVS